MKTVFEKLFPKKTWLLIRKYVVMTCSIMSSVINQSSFAVAQDKLPVQCSDPEVYVYHKQLAFEVVPGWVKQPALFVNVRTLENNFSKNDAEHQMLNEVTVELLNTGTRQKRTLTTYMDGTATFELSPKQEYRITLCKKGYISKTVVLSTAEFKTLDRITVYIPMKKESEELVVEKK